MKEQVLKLINNYNITTFNVVSAILKKYDVHHLENESKDLFLEKFWVLYIDKVIPKKDILLFDNRKIEYNIHGGGCYFKYDIVEINTQFYAHPNIFRISYGVNSLWEYMQSSKYVSDIQNRFQLDEALESLCHEKKIFRSVPLPYKMYHSAQVII